DNLEEDSFIFTNIYTREIIFLKSSKEKTGNSHNIYHDHNLDNYYTIDEIKKILSYEKINLRSRKDDVMKDMPLYSFDMQRRTILIMNRSLAEKIEMNREYSHIKIGQPAFTKYLDKNYLKIKLLDEC